MVHFVGAGPGAPDLITRRGAALLQTADCIIYAGSLVNPALLGLAGPDCATLPGVSQTVIITRMEGRTPVPEGERLAALAAHGATMVIFLSIGLIGRVQDALLQGAYTAATPAAVVYKATWPEQKIVHCTVGTLAESTRAAGITKTALIVVGNFLAAQYDRSKLYDPAFTTEFRRGTDR
uniref:cobalt-precorrin-4/precorrin-4 C(11)-methyltransferase n=1 Tax=Gemmiger formicilis TaxID=745368 RepID=UPI00402917E1